MALEGFGSELGIGATALIVAKIIRDIIVEWLAKKKAVKVIEENGNSPDSFGNPVKGSSANLTLYMVKEQGKKLDKIDADVGKLNEEMTEVRVDVGKVKTRLNME